MNFIIRNFEKSDFDEVFLMMKTFYNSSAVFTNGSDKIFETDINACLDKNNNFAEGFVFISDKEILGYAIIAKSFSSEFGKPCIMLEDLYLKPKFRGFGIIPKFISKIEHEYQNSILKLEVENDNNHAIHVYQKSGFSKLPYIEMIKEI